MASSLLYPSSVEASPKTKSSRGTCYLLEVLYVQTDHRVHKAVAGGERKLALTSIVGGWAAAQVGKAVIWATRNAHSL